MKTILFIEDESALQKVLGDMLDRSMFEVIPALNGEIGLRLAKEKIPDLVLLDLTLPKINGIEVLRELKKNEATKSIPVIVLTNSEDMQNIQKAVELGATTYLVKSNYKLEDVVERIKQCTLNPSN